MKIFKLLLVVGILFGTFSCSDDYLDADLQTQKKFDDGIKTARDLEYLVAGVMTKLNDNTYYGRDFLMFGELRSDNAYNDEGTGRFIRVGRFDLLANDSNARDTWQIIYESIQQCNIIINSTIEDADFYKGQAYGLRALCYFDLNRLYGQAYVNVPGTKLGVPLVLEYDPTVTTPPLARSTYAEVNAQIEKDFLEGIKLMDGKGDVNKMNGNAASALLGRFYLYNENYAAAILHSKPLLSKYALASPKLYAGSWSLEGSSESILELSYTQVDYHGTDSYAYMWADDGYEDVWVSADLGSIFAATDVRFPAVYKSNGKIDHLIKYNFNDKDHNYRLIHIGEVFMNYVEACFESGTELADAEMVLNFLRTSRGVAPVATADITADFIAAERRRELATEGHRYYDLLRKGKNINALNKTGRAADVIVFGSDKCAFPIPEREMDANQNLKNQNPGY